MKSVEKKYTTLLKTISCNEHPETKKEGVTIR